MFWQFSQPQLKLHLSAISYNSKNRDETDLKAQLGIEQRIFLMFSFQNCIYVIF